MDGIEARFSALARPMHCQHALSRFAPRGPDTAAQHGVQLAAPANQQHAGLNAPSPSDLAEPPSTAPEVPLRYRHTASYGEKVKWLPPYRLIPSFASADGQSAVYRRRSQVVLTSDSENDAGGQATSFALPDSEMKVRIDQYGYARLIRTTRSNQHVDPLSNLVDGAADMEREAALAVCAHLNEHVDAMAYPQRWTPSPAVQLVPLSVRPFAEPTPEAPKPLGHKDGKKVYDNRAMTDYLDDRAKWMKTSLRVGVRAEGTAGAQSARSAGRRRCDARTPADVPEGHLVAAARDGQLHFR